MDKETGNFLDLEPLKKIGNSLFPGSPLVLPEEDQTRREVILIGDENIIFRANMDAASSRSCAGMKTAGKIYEYASEINKEVTSTLTTMVEETKNSPCGKYVEEFNNYLTKLASQQTIGYLKIGTAKIAQELAKPTPPPLINSRPRGPLARLLGK